MADRRRLIVVSNRGPLSYYRENGERVGRRGAGGLVTALRSLMAHHDVTWVASAITEEDRSVAHEAGGPVDETMADGSPYRLRLVAHEAAAYDWFYNVVANPMLWFLQHYLWELAYTPQIDQGLHHAWREGYVTVNASFAEAVIEELERKPEATVLFQDYHLYLAPRLVRDAIPNVQLAHFVHIPWPQPDYWHVLPETMRRSIHEGLLGCDLVSFHTQRWQRNFLRSCADLLGAGIEFEAGVALYDDRAILTSARPISVDPVEFERAASSEEVRAEERRLLERRPEYLVVRVDRTDPSKNVVRGFRAFEIYLEAHPEMHARVGMLAKLDPSRQDIPEYSEYVGALQREARRVNDRFQRDGWVPIELRIDDNFAFTVAAYKQFDVLLVNAIYDGMNLIAQEASLVNERGGAVILSENAGAYETIGDFVIGVNPFDVSAQAQAIHQALQQPAGERGERVEALRRHVHEHDLAAWIDWLLADLDRTAAHVH